jgi:hypothetical protein
MLVANVRVTPLGTPAKVNEIFVPVILVAPPPVECWAADLHAESKGSVNKTVERESATTRLLKMDIVPSFVVPLREPIAAVKPSPNDSIISAVRSVGRYPLAELLS